MRAVLTEIHATGGDWSIKPSPSFAPGHEGVGIVTQLGAGGERGRGR
jgi:propanol-preferring alcohol dehydrogenase